MKKGKLLITLEILRQMFKNKKSSKLPKIILVFMILYLFIPTDMIPDFIPIIGILDDLGVITLAITTIASLFKKFKKEKNYSSNCSNIKLEPSKTA